MSRWFTTFIATSLVVIGADSLYGWGQPRENLGDNPGGNDGVEKPLMPTSSFPLNDNQGWYVRESYLIWHPHEDDIDWADRFSSSGTSSEVHTRMEKPDFSWYSGVRIAVGRYLPKHDHWDVAFTTTYYYADKKSHAAPNLNEGKSLLSPWTPSPFSFNFNEGSSVWRLNFFNWDLGVGRNIFLSSKITAHPFFNLRSFLIYEKQSARYSGQQAVAGTTPNLATTKFKGDNDSWGIGPHIGSDFTYYLNKFWTLIGSLSGSVFLGSYSVSEKMNTSLNDTSLGALSNRVINVSDGGYAIRTNLEGSLGMGWEKWVSRNRVRIAPSIVFEAAQWFDMNQWINLKSQNASPDTASYYNTDRFHGDLTIFGFTFNLQVDF